MQENGTKKRLGRFFKHTDKLINKISIAQYSFEEISKIKVLFPDNSNGNIFHARLHNIDELNRTVLPPDKFDDSLLDSNHKMPIIFPRDFTEEWLRDKRRWKRREDGDLEEDLDEEYHGEEKDALESMETPRKEKNSLKGQEKVVVENRPPTQTQPQTQTLEKKTTEHLDQKTLAEPAQNDKLKMVGRAIQDAALHDIHDKKQEPQQPIPEAHPPFIPLDMKNPSGLSNEEDNAVKKYQQNIEDQKKADAQTAVELEEEKKRGFAKGFEEGIEKAKDQVKGEAAEIFGRVNEIISELAKLKTNVLSSIEDNFYELNQAIAEALLNREFNISKDAFAAVLKKALSETMMNDEFKVKVHSETYDKMMALDIKDLKENLVKDDNVKPGDFKIDSKLTSVKGSVKDIVKGLLDKMEVNLFEKQDKAS